MMENNAVRICVNERINEGKIVLIILFNFLLKRKKTITLRQKFLLIINFQTHFSILNKRKDGEKCGN